MGKTKADKEKDKKKSDVKKKPTMKDILAKKSGAGKGKKKWSKTKSKEKLNNSVFWTKSLWDKCNKDIAGKEAYITPTLISEKLKINVSLARAAIQQLVADEKIQPYNNESHSKFGLFVRTEKFQKEIDTKPVEAVKKGGAKKQK